LVNINGLNLNLQDIEGFTALHWAMTLNRMDLAIQLLQKGADPNIKNKKSQLAIHLAGLN